MFERVKRKFRRKQVESKNIGLLVDGPNMLRREFDFDLTKVKNQLSAYGNIKVGKVFLNQFAPKKLIEAIVNQGLEPIVVTTDDVDAPMAAEAMDLIYNQHIDTIALMTRDADFQSVLLKAKLHGKGTIVIGSDPLSVALKNTADHVIMIRSIGG